MQIMILGNTREAIIQNISQQCTKPGLGQLLVQLLIGLVTNAFKYPGVELLLMTTDTVPFGSPVFMGVCVLPTYNSSISNCITFLTKGGANGNKF